MDSHVQAGLLIGAIYGIPLFLLLYGRHFAWVRKLLRLHHWKYRNPYDRTCRVCQRHEVEHGHDMKPRRGWWEVLHEGYFAKPCNRHAIVGRSTNRHRQAEEDT